MSEVKRQLGLPLVTDIHDAEQIDQVASVVDILQTPAFLCRQTDFIKAVAKTGKPINIKKGQFLAPWDMKNVTDKALSVEGHGLIMACERGVSFGYNNLISDMTSLVIMRDTNCPVVFDATHSVQLPGGQGQSSGGRREFVPVLARAAVAVGISGMFMETHPRPDEAKSDGPNSFPMYQIEDFLTEIMALDKLVKKY
jgi:2-dehydro-3-deoxyphosphooctonate aldolase (KDO 8-P synthase)